MRYLVLAVIRCYWLVPKKMRRKCIFKESCSHYIFKQTLLFGAKEGFRCLKLRMQQCKRGYAVYVTPDKKDWVVLVNGSVVSREETAT